jgi:hypothetical protein
VHALTALAVLKLGLSLTVGPEWDSNANRAEVLVGDVSPADPPQASFLLRTTAQGWLSWVSRINLLRASLNVGGKVFFDPAVQDQDVFVMAFSVEDRVRVARPVHLGISADYYDAYQAPVAPYRHRDFRNGSVQARVFLVSRIGEVVFTGGFRGFEYKPNAAFDFNAGQFGINAIARLRLGPSGDHELDFASSYHFEQRFFDSVVQTLNETYHPNPPPPPMNGMPSDPQPCSLGKPIQTYCLVDGTDARNDWLHEMGVEATYVGALLVSFGYAAQLNTSNSFGQSLYRHIFTLKLAYRLPWNLYAAAKAQLYVTKYLDPVLLDPGVNSQTFVTIDDENRNALILDLERPIGTTGLAIDARYSWFTNELSSQSKVSFQRHVVYLGLTYRVGTR